MNRFKSLLERFQRRPECINNRNYRYYALLKVVALVGLFTHFSWIFLFYFLDVPILSLVNFGSVGMFILAWYANQKGKFLLSIGIGLTEVISHQIIGSFCVGSEAGFQYYLIIASFLPFLLPPGRDWLKTLFLILGLSSFLFIEYFIQDTPPIYVLDINTLQFLGYTNIIFAFSFLGIWGIYFAIAILSTEEKLQFEIKRSEELLANVNTKSRELEFKNAAITDSLNYSEKIQRSILPRLSEIKKEIPNTFIYFQPKDVIGGDFYWYYNKEELNFIAAIDCTGHGVPGALMSMTIYALLNEIMVKENITDPAQILGLLHTRLSEALHQNQGDKYAQDGCDVVLCRLNSETNELVYSGAQNDLFIFNNDSLKVLKADKKSIGGLTMLGEFEAERTFTNHKVHVSDQDLIILTTDGVPDQLNQKDQAFGVSEFKAMLMNIFTSRTSEIEELISSKITDWKKGVEQQDDFLVLGFRPKPV